MKYIIVLSDGMAGEPLEELNGKTTLEAANTPIWDRLSKTAEIGLAHMVPEGMAPGSDTANLSVVGYDPKVYYTGRSPLEALSIGVDMKDTDIAIRCNVVTLSEEEDAYEKRKMIDHSAGEITTEEADELLKALKTVFENEHYQFYTGTSYRHLLIWNHGKVAELIPPHDILTREIGPHLPDDDVLYEMMKKSYDILNNHPINVKRRESGLRPANSIWFWGAGTRPGLTSFANKTGKKGAMISAVDLLKGIAVGAEMDNIDVEGASGGLHTNYEGKARSAVNALLKEGYDFVYVHIEAPDEMGHQGLVKEKIEAIEYVDGRITGNIIDGLEAAGEPYRILVLPDHPTPIATRTHSCEPVPYLLYDSSSRMEGAPSYNENSAKGTGIIWKDGYKLIDHLLEIE
ncbi:MAG: cofactor-independent phosphoglycerate mutase [Lachnospiraceae bacterium]